MKNRVKSEIIIMCKSKFFIWILLSEVVLMTYNTFKVGSQMEIPIEGGYYTYISMTLTYLIGIVLPIAMGAFLGGFDENEKMIEYKLCNQSKNDWLLSKLLAIIGMTVLGLLIVSCIGILVDLMKGTFAGNTGINILLVIERFLIITLLWLFWGIFSLAIGLLFASPAASVAISLAIYFGEQYIGRFVRIPFGILWNQKSIEHYFFNNSAAPFGVVQTSYENVINSSVYLLGVFAITFFVIWIFLKRKYPLK